jgi:ABC-type branched-subunit amino acid transport system ATPase component
VPSILAFEKVSKRFGAIVVAQEIDLALAEGEALGIIGPNGAGKTTLFGIASGTTQPDAGRVLLAGTDITRLAPERRCRMGIGRSFQVPQPFSGMTLFENLVVARRSAAAKARRLWPLRRTAQPMRSIRQGEPAGQQPHAARPQAARAGACARHQPRACSTRSLAASPSMNAPRWSS